MSYLEGSLCLSWSEDDREGMQRLWKDIIECLLYKFSDRENFSVGKVYTRMFLEDDYRKRMCIHPDEVGIKWE